MCRLTDLPELRYLDYQLRWFRFLHPMPDPQLDQGDADPGPTMPSKDELTKAGVRAVFEERKNIPEQLRALSAALDAQTGGSHEPPEVDGYWQPLEVRPAPDEEFIEAPLPKVEDMNPKPPSGALDIVIH